MPFQFNLAAVLRYRENVEHAELLVLEKLQHAISALEHKIRQVEESRAIAEQTRAANLARGVQAAHLQSAYEYEIDLDGQHTLLRTQLRDARSKWQQQLHTFQAARRKRELLENLRDQRADIYNREQAKREQNVVDDIFLSRHKRH
jgi:flagellar export protein FliJ